MTDEHNSNVSSFLAAALNRREFALALAAVATSVALGSSPVNAAPSTAPNLLTDLRLAAFQALHGERFALQAEGVQSEVELVTVADQSVHWLRPAQRSAQETFLLTFRDHRQRGVKQGIYTLRHARYGQVELFLVPSPNDANEYVATINHL